MYKNFFKRIFDFLIALSGIIILSPLFLVLIIWLHIANKVSGVFFIQQRPGKNGKVFKLIKFKTMTDEEDDAGRLLPDADRLTPIGSFVRNTSLDEIPQLLNVLKGEMSFVGPRPLLTEYIPLYTDEQNKRHLARPGITGLAQINGRNAISWEDKFKLDVWYVNNLSFVLDLKIVFLTIKTVFKQEGISKDGHATTEAFNGKN